MESFVWELVRLYGVLLQDFTYAYPMLRVEFEKDFARLHRLVMSRGVHLLVEDLPALAKHLDRCLADEEYKLSGLCGGCRYSNRVVIPKLFRGLYLLVFTEDGTLREEPDVQAILFLRQILLLGKKARLDCGPEKTDCEISKFLSTDHDLPVPEKFWNAEVPTEEEFDEAAPGFRKSQVIQNQGRVPEAQWSVLLRNLDTVSGILATTLGAYKPSEWRFRHGPGVTSDGGRWRNKYRFERWSSRLESMFALADCGYHSWPSWAGHAVDFLEEGQYTAGPRLVAGKARPFSWNEDEPHSRLIAVPKTFSKPRLIAAEPGEHMWCQQNCWDYLCNRVRGSWIHSFVRFRDQSLNQDLCRKASRDGSLATLDLSEASDRVTCHVVAQVFRRNPGLLRALQAFRTRRMEYTLKGESHVCELRKFTTMGSSVTFPVESLVFLSVCIASVLTARKVRVTLRNILDLTGQVAVYGDDIIVPVESRVLLVGALEALGLKVNLRKSFWTGKFRESCGVDSFDGVNVSPVYWKAPYRRQPESFASTVDTMNNLYKRFFVRASDLLASTIRGYSLPNVPVGSGVCGRMAFAPKNPTETHKVRWNSNLQRRECLVPHIRVKQEHTPINDDTAVLKFLTEQPDPMTSWESGVPQCPKLKLELRWVSLDLLTDELAWPRELKRVLDA